MLSSTILYVVVLFHIIKYWGCLVGSHLEISPLNTPSTNMSAILANHACMRGWVHRDDVLDGFTILNENFSRQRNGAREM